jgi:hypothetical protein
MNYFLYAVKQDILEAIIFGKFARGPTWGGYYFKDL